MTMTTIYDDDDDDRDDDDHDHDHDHEHHDHHDLPTKVPMLPLHPVPSGPAARAWGARPKK